MGEGDKEPWHLDKRVPVALILAILLQTGSALWWAATVNARVERLEKDAAQTIGTDSRLVRLETQMQSINETLRETKDILRRMESNLLERNRKP